MLLYDFAGNCKAKPAPVRFGGEERLEDPVLLVFRNAGAFVAYNDESAAVASVCLKIDFASASGMNRIHQQVQQHLLELFGIALHFRKRIVNRAAKLDLRTPLRSAGPRQSSNRLPQPDLSPETAGREVEQS